MNWPFFFSMVATSSHADDVTHLFHDSVKVSKDSFKLKMNRST